MPCVIRLLPTVCCVLIAFIFAAPGEARRVALVIGNSTYKVGPLANPANDAAAVAKALETQLKFDKVILKQNLGFIDFRDVLSQFSGEAHGADMAVVYFAGHGIEASGVNYLIPVDAMLRRASDLNLQAIALQTVLEQLERVRTFRFVILDACRDNPFPLPGAKRTVTRGLKYIEPDGNTLVLYAAKHGTTAEDGVGRRHSPFTEALLKHIATPKLDVRILVGRVRDEVMAATAAAQEPHHYGTLSGKEMHLLKDAPAVAEKLPSPEKAPAPDKLPAPELMLPPPPPVVPMDKAPSPAPPPVVQKDKAASLASPPVVQKDKAASLASPPVVQKDKAPSPAPPPVVRKDKAPSISVPRGFAQIVERVGPAVVSIQVVGAGEKKQAEAPGVDSAPLPTQSEGSGFVVSPDGYVVTNNHVIAGAAKLLIIFHQYEKHEAEAVGTDERTDLALLRIKTKTPKTFPTVKLATTTPRVGDWVVAVGNPFGLGGTVTAGIVSAHGRDIGSGPYDYMQIDAAVNKGNSGGPSFNLEGEVVGVNTAIFSPTGVNAGIAFALPASTVSDIIGQLKTHGKIERGWLGVRIQSVDEEMAASLGLSEPKGALVAEVQTPSPAATAGITRGDTILSVNGVRVNDSRDLSRQIFARKPDTFVELRLMRARKEQTLRVKLGVLPPLPPPRS